MGGCCDATMGGQPVERRRVAPQKEALVHFVGLVAILTLAVVITYFDVLRIFEG